MRRRKGATSARANSAEEQLESQKGTMERLHLLSAFDPWDLFLVAIMAFHVVAAPYTKVEESFNVQAMHDLLYHGWNLSEYDHFQFPGVVPRSFLGAMLVSFLASPAVMLLRLAGAPRLVSLYAVRLVLGSLVLCSFILLRRQVHRKFGSHVARALVIVTAAQFHLLFYCSRPLPNVFALALTNVAYSYWLAGHPTWALRYLVFAMVVFRCDLLVLLGPVGLALLLTRAITFQKAFLCCFTAAIASLGVTVAVDSLMWRRLLWPEGEILFFNTALNRSSDWGVSPAHWYFTSALPRALLGALPLALVGVALERRILPYFLPGVLFVILYSALPHKELRFIFPALPMFNLAAAAAVARVFHSRWKPQWGLLRLATAVLLVASWGAAGLLASASYANYPGGHALKLLHLQGCSQGAAPINVHIGVLPAMTGISRFCHLDAPWRYSKEEGLLPAELARRGFNYSLSEQRHMAGFDCLMGVEGFAGFRLHLSPWPFELVRKPQVYIYGRNLSQQLGSLSWPGCS